MLIDRPLWNSVLFLVHVNIARYFYFLVTMGNLTLLFFFYKEVNLISADESALLVPTRCLLSLVSNGNLILLFFIGEQMKLQLSSYQLLFPGY